MHKHCLPILAGFTMLLATLVLAQDRNTKVRNDLADVEATGYWIYNDLDAGISQAQQTGETTSRRLSLNPVSGLQRLRRAGCSSRSGDKRVDGEIRARSHYPGQRYGHVHIPI